jgi:hypothetical protein
MFTTEGGGQSIPSTGGGVAQATKSPTNGLVYNFSVPNPGARPAADFDWTFTGPGSPAAQADKFSGSVTYTGAGAGTIVLTVAAGAGPPAGGTYTITTAPTAGTPRSVEPEGDEEEPPDEEEPDVEVGFDPGAHTVTEVIGFVEDNPDQLEDVLATERAGKDRVTLINHLEEMREG